MSKKKENTDNLSEALGMEVGSVNDEWTAPAIVRDGDTIITRASSRAEAMELREKVMKAIEGCKPGFIVHSDGRFEQKFMFDN